MNIPNHTRALTRIAWSTGALFLISLVAYVVAGFVAVDEPAAAPRITWDPPSISVVIYPGESRDVPVSFNASEELDGATLWITPELQGLVTVAPTTIGHIAGTNTVHAMLNVVAPLTAGPITQNGTVHLKVGNKTISRPLSVVVEVTQTLTNFVGGYSVAVPNGWLAESGVVATASAMLRPIGKYPDAATEYVGDIFIDARANPANLPLAQYYRSVAEIDLFSVSSAQMPLQVNGFEAMRFEGVGGMLPSTIVAIRMDGRIIELTDFNEGHQADGLFDAIVFSTNAAR